MTRRIWAASLAASLVVFAAICIGSGGARAQDRPVVFPQLGHSQGVFSLAFSPDGNTLASGSADETVKLWDVPSRREIRTLGPGLPAIAAAFSPDGRILAVGLFSNNIKLFDAGTGAELRTLTGHLGPVNAVTFSPDGRTIASASDDRTIRFWSVASGAQVGLLGGFSGRATSVVFSPDGHLIAANSEDHVIRLWDLAAGRELNSIKGPAAGVIAFSPDGRIVAAGSAQNTIKFWDVASGREVRTLRGHGDIVRVVAFSPDGRVLASSSYDKTVKLWDVASGRNLGTLSGPPLNLPSLLWATSMAFSPTANILVLGLGDGPIRLWDSATGRELPPLGGRSVGVTSALFSPDGRLVAFGSFDGTVKIWDAASGQELRVLRGHAAIINSVAFSPDGLILASGSADRTVKLWDVASGRELRTLVAHGDQVMSVAFSPDGRMLASGSGDRTVKLWDAATGGQLRTLTGSSTWINAVAFSPDGRMLASSSGTLAADGVNANNSIKLWDVTSGRELRTLIGHAAWVTAVAFSRDGHLLASASGDQTVKLWEAASGREVRTFGGFAGRVSSVAFSPDSRALAAGAHDGTVKLFDVAGGSELRTLSGHSELISSVAFAADGQRLVTASWNSTVRIWNVPTGKERVAFVAFLDASSLAITPEGYYDASSEKAEENLNVRVGARVFAIASYRDKFYRPDVVKFSLAGKSPSELGLAGIDSVKVAPVVELVDVPDTVGESKLTVNVRLTDGGGGIGDVGLFLNGTAVARDSADAGPLLASTGSTRRYTVRLVDGLNVLIAEANNADNTMHSKSAPVKIVANLPSANRPIVHAIVVGIQEFANSNLKLVYPVEDANLFATTLTKYTKGLFSDQPDIKVMTKPEDTTRDALIKSIKAMQSTVGPDDLFVFYVASHGTTDDGEYFLITSNVGSVSTEHLKTDAISKQELTALIASVPATKKLMIIDTCYAGALGNALAMTRGLDEQTAMKILSRSVGTTVLAASTSTQEAVEGYQGHGLFSYVVAEGLAGKGDVDKNGFVSTLGLAHYVDAKVPDLALREFNHKQFPTTEISGQEFPLTKVR
jgi:WD40 repeat protein